MTQAMELAVAIFLPHGREAELMGRLLKANSIDFIICSTATDLRDRIGSGSGPVIMTEQSLSQDGWTALLTQIEGQPTWSDLPIMICQSKEARPLSHSLLARWRNVIALPRPLHIPTFCALLRAAVESRRQQYSLRDLVVRLETVNESLEQRSSLLQRLTLELASAEQNERRRIANDIHDHLAQLLVLSRIKLRQALKNLFDAASYTFLTDTDQMLEESLQYTRTLVAELSPQVLQQSGLLAALKWLSEQMSSHGLMIEAHISADRIAIEHQRAAMVYQSVRELFFNVLKHAGISRAILSVWIEADKDLCITVSDQGRGFDSPSAMKGGIPEKFGLLTMRERIEALQGTFNVRSRVGEGTSVNLRIPIEPVTCAPAHPELPESSPASGTSTAQLILRALIVDDHAMMRQGLRTLLGSYSDIHIIGEAGNGQEAIDRALEHRPDLIIMDVNMPKLNGVAATKTIKGLLPHTCVIGLSYDMSTFRSMCEAGAVTCIDKALAIDQLYQVIREVSDARADACPMPPPSVLS